MRRAVMLSLLVQLVLWALVFAQSSGFSDGS
jgi:hypothetical protein